MACLDLKLPFESSKPQRGTFFPRLAVLELAVRRGAVQIVMYGAVWKMCATENFSVLWPIVARSMVWYKTVHSATPLYYCTTAKLSAMQHPVSDPSPQ